MARKELPEDEGVSQEWLASYADAMTLLLAFFIMMFAFALIDEAKYFDFKVGVTAALGVPDPLTDNTDSILSNGTGISPEIGYTPISAEQLAEAEELRESIEESGLVTPENAEDLRQLLETEFAQVGASEFVDVGIDERGVFVRFDGRVLFASGRAELDDDGLTLLATAADVLGVIENRLEIEGHTDNLATGSAWPSNWELSSARASRVVRWMIETGKIPDPQLMAVGLADTRPRGDNGTTEGRQQNRRVEIVVRVEGMVDSGVPLVDPGLDDPVGIGADTADGADEPASEDATEALPSDDGADPGSAAGETDLGLDDGIGPDTPQILEDPVNSEVNDG